jgi:biopolymer transport protein ExbD
MRFRRNKRQRPGFIITITPLVNVLFLLLMIFALSLGAQLRPDHGFLKRGGSAPSPSMTVLILPGKVLLDGRTVNDQALPALPRNRDIVIRVGKDIPYSRVAGILERLRSTGHTRLSLATKPVND